MTNIFLSHSSNDIDKFVGHVAKELKRQPDSYTIWYYDRLLKGCDDPMNVVLEKLNQTDLFIVFISHNSLCSGFVKVEMDRAIELHKNGIITEVLAFVIDSSLDINIDDRIPEHFKKNNLIYVRTPQNAILLIKKCCSNM